MTWYHFILNGLVTRVAREKLPGWTFSQWNSTYFNSFFPRTILELWETISWCLIRKQCNFQWACSFLVFILVNMSSLTLLSPQGILEGVQLNWTKVSICFTFICKKLFLKISTYLLFHINMNSYATKTYGHLAHIKVKKTWSSV